MKKQHKNAAVIDVPDYKTLKEIIVHGTEMGGDKKMLVYLDKTRPSTPRPTTTNGKT